MKAMRWIAVVATILMSLMNLPIAVDSGDNTIPAPLGWAISLLGVVGLAAATGLILKARWGRPAVVAVGLVNVVAAVVALFQHWEGAPIGLAVGGLGLIFGLLATDARTPRPATTA